MIQITFRKAELRDSNDILIWRNDIVTRQNSFNSEKISNEEHKRWIKDVIYSSEINLFIITNNYGNKLGVVRFNNKDNHTEINITIAPKYRNKGFGSKVIKQISNYYIKEYKISYIIAKIKPENIYSIKAFENVDYKFHKKYKNHIELKRKLFK